MIYLGLVKSIALVVFLAARESGLLEHGWEFVLINIYLYVFIEILILESNFPRTL